LYFFDPTALYVSTICCSKFPQIAPPVHSIRSSSQGSSPGTLAQDYRLGGVCLVGGTSPTWSGTGPESLPSLLLQIAEYLQPLRVVALAKSLIEMQSYRLGFIHFNNLPLLALIRADILLGPFQFDLTIDIRARLPLELLSWGAWN
jgi:hypothetical protein